MKQVVHLCAVLAFLVAAGCNQSRDVLDERVNDSPTAIQTAEPQPTGTVGGQTDTTDADQLPPTSSLLPLAGVVGLASLGGAFLLKSMRRRWQR